MEARGTVLETKSVAGVHLVVVLGLLGKLAQLGLLLLLLWGQIALVEGC